MRAACCGIAILTLAALALRSGVGGVQYGDTIANVDFAYLAEVTATNAIDGFVFGVASISADGFESPVVFPGAAGAFWAP